MKYLVILFLILFVSINTPAQRVRIINTYQIEDSLNKIIDSIIHSKTANPLIVLNKNNIRSQDKGSDLEKYLLPVFTVILTFLLSWFLSNISFNNSFKKNLEKEEAAKKDKYTKLLTIISDEVKRNLKLECQMYFYFSVLGIPSFPLSLYLPDKLFKQITEVCLNLNLFAKITERYYEFTHIQRRIDLLLERLKLQNLDQDKFAKQESLSIAKLIFNNIIGTRDLYNEIICEINNHRKDDNKIETLSNTDLENIYEEFRKCPDVLHYSKLSGIDPISLNKII